MSLSENCKYMTFKNRLFNRIKLIKKFQCFILYVIWKLLYGIGRLIVGSGVNKGGYWGYLPPPRIRGLKLPPRILGVSPPRILNYSGSELRVVTLFLFLKKG